MHRVPWATQAFAEGSAAAKRLKNAVLLIDQTRYCNLNASMNECRFSSEKRTDRDIRLSCKQCPTLLRNKQPEAWMWVIANQSCNLLPCLKKEKSFWKKKVVAVTISLKLRGWKTTLEAVQINWFLVWLPKTKPSTGRKKNYLAVVGFWEKNKMLRCWEIRKVNPTAVEITSRVLIKVMGEKCTVRHSSLSQDHARRCLTSFGVV